MFEGLSKHIPNKHLQERRSHSRPTLLSRRIPPWALEIPDPADRSSLPKAGMKPNPHKDKSWENFAGKSDGIREFLQGGSPQIPPGEENLEQSPGEGVRKSGNP